MDPITRAQKEMYEEFPYPPSGAPEQRVGWDARLLLSYVEATRPDDKRPIRVLDAGCGRGAGLLGAAMLQPDVEFLGVDVNSVGLAEARQRAHEANLHNVRFAEVDLTTLEGLEAPDGGFDIIFSSGVVHHMPDPAEGLAKLRSKLAPHGVLQLMVYAHDGRAPLRRLARAIEMLAPAGLPIRDRLAIGKALLVGTRHESLELGPWQDLARLPDAEFVDRYLHPNETSFDVEGVFSLLDSAGLRFVRWSEPNDWNPQKLISQPQVAELVTRLPIAKRYALVEQLTWKTKLELVACDAANRARKQLSGSAVYEATWELSPEIRLRTDIQFVGRRQRVDRFFVQIRSGEPIRIVEPAFAAALFVLRDAESALSGREIVEQTAQRGVAEGEARLVLESLADAEIIFAPKRTEQRR